MTKSLIIIGGKAGVKIAHAYTEDQYDKFYGYNNFLNDLTSLKIKKLLSLEELAEIGSDVDTEFFVATGDNKIREELSMSFSTLLGKPPVNIVHKTAEVIGNFPVGFGTLICANATLNLCSEIGAGCIINTNAVIEHDCKLDDFAQVSPGAILTGYCGMGQRSFLGAGSVLNPGIQVGSDAIIGSLSVVTRDVVKSKRVKGIPAREY